MNDKGKFVPFESGYASDKEANEVAEKKFMQSQNTSGNLSGKNLEAAKRFKAGKGVKNAVKER